MKLFIGCGSFLETLQILSMIEDSCKRGVYSKSPVDIGSNVSFYEFEVKQRKKKEPQ